MTDDEKQKLAALLADVLGRGRAEPRPVEEPRRSARLAYRRCLVKKSMVRVRVSFAALGLYSSLCVR